MKFLLCICLFLAACTVTSIAPGEGADLEIDLSKIDMRHGWTILTQPNKTSISVNDETSIERGKKLFNNYCTQCHGETGEGNGALAKSKGLIPANLKNISKDTNNTYLVVQINKGKGDMPQWEDFLSPKDAWDLSNYIRTLSKGQK